VSVEREAALRDYLDHEIPGPLPAGRLARSRSFSLFVEATPGMGELLSIGKVWELAGATRRRREAQAYDLVVLDAPASGQLLALLQAPRTFGAIARVGPVAHQTKAIGQMLTDQSQTGVVLVTTPEQLAVSEALDLGADLKKTGLAVDAVVVNRIVRSPFSDHEASLLHGLGADDPAIGSARWLCDRAAAQSEQLERLTRVLSGVPQRRLPLLVGGVAGRQLEDLAERLSEGEA
jgi:anion-transporting  ArsA/GET3 family ATPase